MNEIFVFYKKEMRFIIQESLKNLLQHKAIKIKILYR